MTGSTCYSSPASCPSPTSPYPCGGGGSFCACPSYSWNPYACSRHCNTAPPNSPVLVDVGGDGFDSLRLWRDANHNGVSEAGELHAPRQLGLNSLDLDYKESRRTDRHGNRFQYRAKVMDTRDAQPGRWAWDVSLVPGP